jgi:type I restriction-modification system DNA methylase subunit
MSQLSFDALFSPAETPEAVTVKPVMVTTAPPAEVVSLSRPVRDSSVSQLDNHRKDFVKLFRETARYHNRFQVFRDFVTMAAVALENAFLQCDELENEYFQTIAGYEKDDLNRMARLLALVTSGLDAGMCDFLGSIFMELEISSKEMGQFFTPFSLSELIAGLVMGQRVQELADGAPYITLDEPTCGAGGMVIAAAKVLLDRGYNPQTQLLVQCTDLDPVAARMCYVQLSLLGIPACVRIGNSLSQKITREMYTPFWYRIKGSRRTF